LYLRFLCYFFSYLPSSVYSQVEFSFKKYRHPTMLRYQSRVLDGLNTDAHGNLDFSLLSDPWGGLTFFINNLYNNLKSRLYQNYILWIIITRFLYILKDTRRVLVGRLWFKTASQSIHIVQVCLFTITKHFYITNIICR